MKKELVILNGLAIAALVSTIAGTFVIVKLLLSIKRGAS